MRKMQRPRLRACGGANIRGGFVFHGAGRVHHVALPMVPLLEHGATWWSNSIVAHDSIDEGKPVRVQGSREAGPGIVYGSTCGAFRDHEPLLLIRKPSPVPTGSSP